MSKGVKILFVILYNDKFIYNDLKNYILFRLMTIKHLVISGGGPIMFQIISAIQELERKEYLNMKNIFCHQINM